jgi:acyl-lipid (7-3)-desaturase (Delta-4 desaturase)
VSRHAWVGREGISGERTAVANLSFSVCLLPCRYKFDTEFEREIKREVFKIVRRGREFATWGYILRCAFYVSFFFYLQYLWVTNGPSWTLAIVYGIAQALIGLNVQHDANHGAVSKNHRINDILGLGADFIGGSKWLWLEQHWTVRVTVQRYDVCVPDFCLKTILTPYLLWIEFPQHHTYTNHAEKDPDSFGAEPMLLFNDYPLGHPARTAMHQFQAFFYLPVLAGYWLSSVFNPQILDLQQRGALSIGIKLENDFVKSRRKYAIALRLLYIVTNIVTPFYHTDPLTAFGQIMLMGVAESLTLAILFSLSHNFEHCDRDPTEHFRKTGEPVCWFKSQVETSCTYGGFISGALTGGLNFQVEHHLFPRMSSAWYPYIAPTVREVCKKHGVKYAYYPWVFTNFVSTLKYIHAAGNGSNWIKDPLSGKN